MLADVLAPLIEADGGELYLVNLAKKELKLHFGGVWSGSPAAEIVTRRVIEPAIRAVAPKTKLVVSTGYTVPAGAERIRASE
jgi:Fe-S cluster biogenesis protein NfuA